MNLVLYIAIGSLFIEKRGNVISNLTITVNQGRSKQSSWSSFGQTTISQGKSNIPFYKKQVINKSTMVIFGLVQLVILSRVNNNG